MRLRILALLVTTTLARTVPAQVTWRGVGDDFSHAGSDIWYVWTSPFHAGGRDWLGAGGVAVGFAAITPLDKPVAQWVASHQESVIIRAIGPLRASHFIYRGITLGNLATVEGIAPLGGAAYIIGLASHDLQLREGGLTCIGLLEASVTTREVVYRSVGRKRPYSSPDDQYHFSIPGGDSTAHSFFSGHSANVMSCMSYLNHRFDLRGFGPFLYVLPAGIGLARMADGAHWLSDTALGLTFGYALGANVARRSLDRKRSAEERQRDAVEYAAARVAGGRTGFSFVPEGRGGTVGFKIAF
ncbi:MAG: phosphatase PAP2 family protein [Gemmatimonadota bacterium]|nr:phosphatase PAP2 family protein [Gemmatimonadota bacterium]